MTAKGHILVATTITSIVIPSAFYNKYAALLLILGALTPDIDEPASSIGRRLFFIAYPLRVLGIEHRTFTHSLFFVLFFLPLILINKIFIFLILGIFLHLVGDMLTKTGVPLLYPVFKNYFNLLPAGLRFRTGSVTEQIIILLLLSYNLFFFAHFLHINYYKFFYILYNTHNLKEFLRLF